MWWMGVVVLLPQRILAYDVDDGLSISLCICVGAILKILKLGGKDVAIPRGTDGLIGHTLHGDCASSDETGLSESVVFLS